jgi:hypothetical protein
MVISDSILRDVLTDVYWITGGPCAGKTTVTEILSRKHGFAVLPDRFSDYQARADLAEHPALRYPGPGTDWEWFFNRPIDEYVAWLEDVARSTLEFIVVDLLTEHPERPIIVERFTDPRTTMQLASPGSVALLFADEELVRQDLLQREDHRPILECIQANTTDPAAAEENVIAATIEHARRRHRSAVEAGVPVLTRRQETCAEELVWEVEEIFGLGH